MLEVVWKLLQCSYGRINSQQHKLLAVGKTLEAVKHLSWYAVRGQVGVGKLAKDVGGLGWILKKGGGMGVFRLFLTAAPSPKQHRDDEWWGWPGIGSINGVEKYVEWIIYSKG